VIVHDLRHAARLLRRNPGFTLAATLTPGLGIGATTTMFSVVNAVLLDSLPFGRPDRLRWRQHQGRQREDAQHDVSTVSCPSWSRPVFERSQSGMITEPLRLE